MTEEDVKALVVTHVLMRGAASLESCIHGNFPWEDSARYIGAGTWIVGFGEECTFTVDDRTGKVSP